MQMIAISDNTRTNFTKKKYFNSINEINYKCTLWILEELLFFIIFVWYIEMTLTSKWKEIKFFPKHRIQLIVENLTILTSLSIKTIFFLMLKKKKNEEEEEDYTILFLP